MPSPPQCRSPLPRSIPGRELGFRGYARRTGRTRREAAVFSPKPPGCVVSRQGVALQVFAPMVPRSLSVARFILQIGVQVNLFVLVAMGSRSLRELKESNIGAPGSSITKCSENLRHRVRARNFRAFGSEFVGKAPVERAACSVNSARNTQF